jgi:hypothetical protein
MKKLFKYTTKPRVSLNITHSSWYCSCCGGVYDTDVAIYVNDKHQIELNHDGHQGGGNWNGDEDKTYLMVLALLGYRIDATYQRKLADGSIVSITAQEVDDNNLDYLLSHPLLDEEHEGYNDLNYILQNEYAGVLKPIYVSMLVSKEDYQDKDSWDRTIQANLDIDSDKFMLYTGEAHSNVDINANGNGSESESGQINWPHGDISTMLKFIVDQLCYLDENHEHDDEPWPDSDSEMDNLDV